MFELNGQTLASTVTMMPMMMMMTTILTKEVTRFLAVTFVRRFYLNGLIKI